MGSKKMIRSDLRSFKLKLQIATLAIICFVYAPMIAVANVAEEYVAGTVSKISENTITVRTAAGKFIKVTLDEKTTYLHAKRPIHRSSIRDGDRVVIRALKVENRLKADTVEVRPRNRAGYI